MALGSDRFWRVLGRSAQKAQSTSRRRVDRAQEHAEWAAALSETELATEATALRVDNAEAWKAERHDSIEAVTGGGQVVISRDQRILNLPGVK